MPNFVRYLRGTVAVLVALLLLMPLAGCRPTEPEVLPEPPEPPARAASLVISPMSGVERDFITIYGAGFVPGEIIEVIMVVEGAPHKLARFPFGIRGKFYLQANEYGAFFATGSAIPLGTPPGIYTVTARGNKGSIATFPVEVLEKEE